VTFSEANIELKRSRNGLAVLGVAHSRGRRFRC
jgi:hypothetical protein